LQHNFKKAKEVDLMSSQLKASELSVLIVDDDDFAQEMFSCMLEQSGVKNIQLANNGQNALTCLASMERAPDFLICDVFMPDMDGIEFLGKLGQQHFPGSIILVSGMNIEMMAIARDIALSDNLNVVAAFVKPVNHELLADAMGLFGNTTELIGDL